jgi:hypothetical protein
MVDRYFHWYEVATFVGVMAAIAIIYYLKCGFVLYCEV